MPAGTRTCMVLQTSIAVFRFNHFPAAPLCSLSWWFEGCSHNVLLTDDNRHAPLSAPRQPMPGRWVLGGPHTQPTCSWCPGPVHAMMVLLMPDAVHQLTGLAPEALTNRFVDAEAVLPPDWLPMLHDVQAAPDDATGLARLEAFLALPPVDVGGLSPAPAHGPGGDRTGPRAGVAAGLLRWPAPGAAPRPASGCRAGWRRAETAVGRRPPVG